MELNSESVSILAYAKASRMQYVDKLTLCKEMIMRNTSSEKTSSRSWQINANEREVG